MKNYLVTIIIPCYNYGQYLAEAIESALNQTYRNVEIIIIDDGSTDNTREIADQYIPEIKYFYKKNGGDSDARNFGIKHAQGDFVVFLDADNKLDKEFIAKTLNKLSNDSTSFIYTQLQYFGLQKNKSQFKEFNFDTLKYQNDIDACSLIRKEVFQFVQYDINFSVFQDWDFYLSLGEKGFFGKLLDEPLVHYRKHSKSQISKLKSSDTASERLAYIKIYNKHWKLYPKIFLLRWIVGHYMFVLFEKFNLNS